MLRPVPPLAVNPAHAGVGAARPSWITPELVALTLSTWQPYYTQTLTDDDAVEMLMTVGNLYRVLAGGNDDEHQHEGGPGRRQDAA